MPFELVTPLGTLSHGGVCGLVRGGGDGHLGRRLALSVDNMVCVDVVTADGQLGHAIDAEHPISSGAQGGGGNFGIVTNFELRLRPRDNVAVQSARVLDLRLLRQQDAARHGSRRDPRQLPRQAGPFRRGEEDRHEPGNLFRLRANVKPTP